MSCNTLSFACLWSCVCNTESISHVGVYEIVDRGGRKTSFAYKLEIPQELGEVQQELQIKKEASYTLSMKVCQTVYHFGSVLSVCCLCLHVMSSDFVRPMFGSLIHLLGSSS